MAEAKTVAQLIRARNFPKAGMCFINSAANRTNGRATAKRKNAAKRTLNACHPSGPS
jgi:hypothetical protein